MAVDTINNTNCISGDAAAAVTAANQEMKRDHVMIFPFMAKGHTIPLLHLSAALSSRGIHVTLITTPANAPFIHHQLPSVRHPLVTVLTLPFPHLPPLPAGVESTDTLPSLDLYPTFLQATALLRIPFHRLLLHQAGCDGGAASRPLCLISDFFLGWTLPVCRQLGLPRLVFHGMSVFSMALCKSILLHQPHAGDAATFHVPGTPPSLLLAQVEVPVPVRNSADPDDPVTQFLLMTGDYDISSWGVLVNSFAELDRDYVALFESFYRDGARAWLVGPLCLLGGDSETESRSESDPEGCLEWLDRKTPDSVVYVSFGTQTHVPDAQLDEVAHGLAESGHDFLWTVRSKTWAPPVGLDMTKCKIVKGWVPQKEILGHAAVGAFLSHCGWNSVLESLSAGVQILAWPMMAEQPLNAKHVSELLGVGTTLRTATPDEIIRRQQVAQGVKEIVGGERAQQARMRAAAFRRAAAEAVAEGGSSNAALEELLTKLREFNTKKTVSSGNGLEEKNNENKDCN